MNIRIFTFYIASLLLEFSLLTEGRTPSREFDFSVFNPDAVYFKTTDESDNEEEYYFSADIDQWIGIIWFFSTEALAFVCGSTNWHPKIE